MKTKLVIFGITGDLARQKLIPSLRKIVRSKVIDELELIGVSRHKINIKEIVGDELARISKGYMLNVDNPPDYLKLKKYLNLKRDEQLVVYLSVPPLAATQITDYLGQAKLNTKNIKILFEKPFGVDLESARNMVKRTSRYFDEDQIYRIDHYLAKEMAQNIVAFRSGNAMLRHVWSRQSIERIEVLALEEVGVRGRAQFYEQTGALRDIVQGHLMQLLALMLMDTPSKLDWDQLPRLRNQALARLLPADPKRAVRAQYQKYREEVGNPESDVETFVATEIFSDSSTWEDVPLRLITGKALGQKTTEINIYFRASHTEQSNCLRFRIQPDEGVEIDLYTKKPGYDRSFEMQKLLFKYPDETALPNAYEQVIVDAVLSRKSLFTSSDEILESWRVLQPLLDAWASDSSPIKTYRRGSDYQKIIPARMR